MNYDKQKEGELNEEEFVKFWADFYALFDKIDKDGGNIIINLDSNYSFTAVIDPCFLSVKFDNFYQIKIEISFSKSVTGFNFEIPVDTSHDTSHRYQS